MGKKVPQIGSDVDEDQIVRGIQDPDLKIVFVTLLKKMESLDLSTKFISEKFDECLSKNIALEKKVCTLEKELRDAKYNHNKLEQYGRSSNIEIFGLESSPGENLKE